MTTEGGVTGAPHTVTVTAEESLQLRYLVTELAIDRVIVTIWTFSGRRFDGVIATCGDAMHFLHIDPATIDDDIGWEAAIELLNNHPDMHELVRIEWTDLDRLRIW